MGANREDKLTTELDENFICFFGILSRKHSPFFDNFSTSEDGKCTILIDSCRMISAMV
ncbi:hypothetical protein D3C79_1113810 [compost metagenome]